jgi:hypothetical protein
MGAFATGVLIVDSPRRLPPKERGGGVFDLAAVGDDERGTDTQTSHAVRPWTLATWLQDINQRNARALTTSWRAPEVHPALGPGASVIGDGAKRLTFSCTNPNCRANPTVLNVTLLRLMLSAIANGERRVTLDTPTAPTQSAHEA